LFAFPFPPHFSTSFFRSNWQLSSRRERSKKGKIKHICEDSLSLSSAILRANVDELRRKEEESDEESPPKKGLSG